MAILNRQKVRELIEETLREAETALSEGNVPIGSLIVGDNGAILASCHNENYTRNDITAHAEMLCLRKMGNATLDNDIQQNHYLFSSLEPCGGCGFFIAKTNIKRVYAAALDPYRAGTSILKKHFSEVFDDVDFMVCDFPDLADKSKSLMRKYFLKKDKFNIAKVYVSNDRSR